MNFTRDFLDFISILNGNEVHYMIVGGYAVGLHGYPRYTGDLDIWVHKKEENIEKLIIAITEFGGPSALIDKDQLLRSPTIENPCPGVGFGREPVRIEIISSVQGISFEECYNKSIETEINNIKIKYIQYDDLIKNKLSTGRTKDKADVEELEKKRNTKIK